MPIVKREDFDAITEIDAKLGILFETSIETNKCLKDNIQAVNTRFEAGNIRFRKLENRKLFDRAFAVGGGVAGGFGAVMAKMIFWK